MAEQELNGANICTLLQEMYGEGMAQRMRRDGFGNLTSGVGFLTCLLHRIPGDVPAWPFAHKEPVLRSFHTPPTPQDLQQFGRQHYVAIFLALALLDAQDHALA